MDKILGIIKFLGANGAGPSTSSNSEVVNGSWLTELLAWLGDAIVKLATLVWGWLITIFYFVVRFCLNLIDILQMFVEKLVGIEMYNQEGGISAVKDIKDTDMIIRFITNETILKTFKTIMVLGLILLIIFCILALIKQNYQAAITDGADGAKKTPRDVLKLAARAIFMCILVPFLLVFGILGSNAVLASVCNAIKGDNDLTIGGLIFTASAYEANKFREYASDGLRVPITLSNATEVVNPGNYSTVEDMQVLFYKLASGQIYISAISDDIWFINNQSTYSAWVDALTAEDVEVDASKLMGNAAFSAFKTDFNTFNNHYFKDGGKTYALSEFNMFNPIIKSIYNSNWVNNRKLKNLTYDFSSSYKTQREVEFSSRDGKKDVAHIIVNSENYRGHENFATIELEYYVMADLIDFAIEQNKTFYYVNASNTMIQWSDIVLDPKKPNKKINIEEYNNQFLVAKTESSEGDIYQAMAYTTTAVNAAGTVANLVTSAYGNGAQLVSENSFMVKYYNGVNRLYWSETGSTSEDTGATYIICTKTDDGFYIPVTQTTTKFRSSFLAKNYGGPIVARGIFQGESLIPKEYCLPTAISEQIVDDQGNELKNINRTSPFALSDSYVESTNVGSVMSEFCGTLYNFTGGPAFKILEGLFEASSNAYKKWEATIKDNLMNQLAEDDEIEVEKEGGGTEKVRSGNLLINPNIQGFSYSTNAEGKKVVTFYDYNGRKITAGAAYQDSDMTEFELTDKSIYSRPAYVVLQKEIFGDIVIPWYFTDATNLGQIAKLIVESEIDTNNYTFLVAEYTYDNIQIKLDKLTNGATAESDTFRMLLNFNVKQIYEFNRTDTSFTGKTSGEFIVADSYAMINGYDIMVEKKANLVVSGGEIFYSNGTLYFGKDDAKALYQNIMSNYLQTKLTTSIMGYIDIAEGQKQLDTLLTKLSINKLATFKDSLPQSVKDQIAAIEADSGLDEATKKSKVNEILFANGYEEHVSAGFMASDFRAGLAALITEYGKSYYTIEEKVGVDGDGNPKTTGTIKYYNKNNQEMSSETVTYSTKKHVEGYTITQRLAVVGGANNSINPSFAAVINHNSAINSKYSINELTNDTFADVIFEKIDEAVDFLGGATLTATDIQNRQTWYYDVTYTFSFWEYKNDAGTVVAVLGTSIDNIDIEYPTAQVAGSVDPGYLKVKNNGVYSTQLGKYILTANGVKNYIANEVETKSAGGTPVKNITVGLTAGLDESGAAISTGVSSNTSLQKLKSDVFKIKSQSEYNNIYTYFSRGNLGWTMLFDFCINLPTISWKPFTLRFVFRCRLGTSYDYAESVIYRLQGGMFYLDYNFRNSTGIGMQNLFRMSAINPFILIFSTVLVLSIIWKTVWGLIRRVYDVVLLFIILPAVCSTMPMDEGGRFTNWRKELVEQVLAAYSVLITLNLYFVLVPIIKDVTSDLITAGDLPTTITGMFNCISMGVTGFMGMIGNIGTKLAGAVTSVGSGINNLCGNIGLSRMLLETELTTAQQAVLGHVNSIVYIMFFLVLTTMLNNGKALIEKILELGKLDEKAGAEAIGNLNNVAKKAKNVVSKPIGLAAKGAGALVGGAVKLGSKAFGAMMQNKAGMEGTAGMLNGAADGLANKGKSEEPPEMAPAPETPPAEDQDARAGQDPNENFEGTALYQGDAQVPEEEKAVDASGEGKSYGFQATGADYASVDANYGDKSDDDINADIDELMNMKSGEVNTVRSEVVDGGAVNSDGSFMSLGQFEDAKQNAINEVENARKESIKLDAERMRLQAEGKFNGEAKAAWDEQNNKNNQAKADAERRLNELKSYDHAYNDQRQKEADVAEGYDKEIKSLESYRDTRKANADAQANLEGDAKASGLTIAAYTELNNMLNERKSFEEMKQSVNSTFSSEEDREKANAEIDAEIAKLDEKIIGIKSTAATKDRTIAFDEYTAAGDRSRHGGISFDENQRLKQAVGSADVGEMDTGEMRKQLKDKAKGQIRELRSQSAQIKKEASEKLGQDFTQMSDEEFAKAMAQIRNTTDNGFKAKIAETARVGVARARAKEREISKEYWAASRIIDKKDAYESSGQKDKDSQTVQIFEEQRAEHRAKVEEAQEAAGPSRQQVINGMSDEQLQKQIEAAKSDTEAKKFKSEEDRQAAISSMESELRTRMLNKEAAARFVSEYSASTSTPTPEPTTSTTDKIGNMGSEHAVTETPVYNAQTFSGLSLEELRKQLEAAEKDKDSAKFLSPEDRQKAIDGMKKEIEYRETARAAAANEGQNPSGKADKGSGGATPTGNVGNAGISDEELAKKILNGGLVGQGINNKQYKQDHAGFTADQFKEEETRVRALKEKMLKEYEERISALDKSVEEKGKAVTDASKAREEIDARIKAYESSNPGKEIPAELAAELEKAKKAQDKANEEFNTVSTARKQAKDDRGFANKQFANYARTLKLDGDEVRSGKTSGGGSPTTTAATPTSDPATTTARPTTSTTATPTSEPSSATPTESSETPSDRVTVSTATPTSTTKTTKTTKTKAGKSGVGKKIAVGAGLAAAAFVTPVPVVMAVAGGVLGVKGVKAAKNSKLGKAVSGKISSANNYLGSHPKAKTFATAAALSLVAPAVGVGYAVVKGVKGRKNAKKAGGSTPPPVAPTPSPTSSPSPGRGPAGPGPAPGPGPGPRPDPKHPSPYDKRLRDEMRENNKKLEAEIERLSKKLESAQAGDETQTAQLKKELETQRAELKKVSEQLAEARRNEQKEDSQDAASVQAKITELEKKIAQTEERTRAESKKTTDELSSKIDKAQHDVDFVTDYAGGLEDELKKVKTSMKTVDEVSKKTEKLQRDVDFVTDYAGGLEDQIKDNAKSSKSSSTRSRMKDLYTDDGGAGQEMAGRVAQGLAERRSGKGSKATPTGKK